MLQIGGLEEDQVNKPHRPIPSGLLSLQGAAWRLLICSGAMGLLACQYDMLWHAVAVQALLVLHYRLGWDSHWFAKNIFVGTITGVSVSAEGHLAGKLLHHTVPALDAISAVLGVMIVLSVSVQDFKDVAGDAAVGRRTLPLVIGDRAARAVCSALVALVSLLWPGYVCGFLSPWELSGMAVQVLLGLQGLLAGWLAWHIVASGKQGDARYMFAGYVGLFACWLFTVACLPVP